MSVFDAHFHLSGDRSSYDLQVLGRNIIFNDVPSYRAFESAGPRAESDAVSLVVAIDDDRDFVLDRAQSGALDALKIHSRIQGLDAQRWIQVRDSLAAFPSSLPIIIDAFYYGKELHFQPSLSAIIALMDAYPERAFVVAHCGGYRILEYFFHLRQFTNCYYDLSLTLQYLSDTSLRDDVKKLIRFTDKSKLLFGSDHPGPSPSRQLAILKEISAELGLSDEEIDAICCQNALRLFGKDRKRSLASNGSDVRRQ